MTVKRRLAFDKQNESELVRSESQSLEDPILLLTPVKKKVKIKHEHQEEEEEDGRGYSISPEYISPSVLPAPSLSPEEQTIDSFQESSVSPEKQQKQYVQADDDEKPEISGAETEDMGFIQISRRLRRTSSPRPARRDDDDEDDKKGLRWSKKHWKRLEWLIKPLNLHKQEDLKRLPELPRYVMYEFSGFKQKEIQGRALAIARTLRNREQDSR